MKKTIEKAGLSVKSNMNIQLTGTVDFLFFKDVNVSEFKKWIDSQTGAYFKIIEGSKETYIFRDKISYFEIINVSGESK